MPAYQLQIKQVVDYPRCRIYRQFIHRLIDDRSIRASGGSGLFYYTVLCSFANFRTSYRQIDGISYTVYPGEWVCTLKELSQWFRTRFQCQALSILGELQQRHLIDFSSLGRGNVIRYKIRNWARHNTVLEYNAPCQKDTGFFFLPVSIVTDLISSDRCSEMDIVLDLWVSAIYNDSQVQGSGLG
ncbi:MAG: MarR family transcriptional regulator, partial [Clostridia bacterium]|nr:MarR family transcriptional regulator [Clostridia bacterium]